MDCCHYDFEGVNFIPVSRSVTIPKYGRAIIVASLASVPATVHDDHIEDRLVARGGSFLGLYTSARAHRAYEGLTLDDQPSPVDSEFIIDLQSALRVTTSWVLNLGICHHPAWNKSYIRIWTAMEVETNILNHSSSYYSLKVFMHSYLAAESGVGKSEGRDVFMSGR